jgi:hypothetical protein
MIPISTNIAFAQAPSDPPQGCWGEVIDLIQEDIPVSRTFGFFISGAARAEDARPGFGDNVQQGLDELCGIGSGTPESSE